MEFRKGLSKTNTCARSLAQQQTPPRPGPRSSPSLPLAPFYPSTASHRSFPEATLPNYRVMGHKIPTPEHANPSAEEGRLPRLRCGARTLGSEDGSPPFTTAGTVRRSRTPFRHHCNFSETPSFCGGIRDCSFAPTFSAPSGVSVTRNRKASSATGVGNAVFPNAAQKPSHRCEPAADSSSRQQESS